MASRRVVGVMGVLLLRMGAGYSAKSPCFLVVEAAGEFGIAVAAAGGPLHEVHLPAHVVEAEAPKDAGEGDDDGEDEGAGAEADGPPVLGDDEPAVGGEVVEAGGRHEHQGGGDRDGEAEADFPGVHQPFVGGGDVPGRWMSSSTKRTARKQASRRRRNAKRKQQTVMSSQRRAISTEGLGARGRRGSEFRAACGDSTGSLDIVRFRRGRTAAGSIRPARWCPDPWPPCPPGRDAGRCSGRPCRWSRTGRSRRRPSRPPCRRCSAAT